ncbi:hypothetical protein N0V90_006497 [Kalmusia sp. IMI 367209]|nr:hypothetical protein N0V90_006497 [Kalmusia sp. IMI 367209]
MAAIRFPSFPFGGFDWDGLVNTWADDEGRADEVQKKKDEQLSKQKEGKGHWEEGLASDSESIVKADRNEAESSAETIQKLQEETAKIANKKSRA